MNGNDWCKHYNGIPMRKCEAGVQYSDIESRQDAFPRRTQHCTNPDAPVKCALHELESPEVIAARNERLAKFIRTMNDIWDRTGEECPHCGGHVSACEQVGRCVYARPCGCRIGQGKLHKNWKT